MSCRVLPWITEESAEAVAELKRTNGPAIAKEAKQQFLHLLIANE